MFPLPLGMKKQKPRHHCWKVVLKAFQDEFLFSLQKIFCLEAVSYSVSGAYFSRIVVVFSACVSTGKRREHIWGWDVRKTIFTKLWWIQRQPLIKQDIFLSYPICCSCTVMVHYNQDSMQCKELVGDTTASIQPERKAKIVLMAMYFHIDYWT